MKHSPKIIPCLIVATIVLLFTNCSINGNLKGLYSNYRQTQKTNTDLFIKPQQNICSIIKIEPAKIYVINGKQMHECIDKTKKCIIYVWPPNCKSKLCLPLKEIENKCKILNIKLFIVAEYYDNTMMTLNHNISVPLFGIDTEYYHTDLTSKYMSDFFKDISKITYDGKNYFYFENGNYNGSFTSLEALTNAQL